MKNKLASLYEQILLNEENSLQDKNNKVGSGTVTGGNKTLFTTVPNPSKENSDKNVKVENPKNLDRKTTSPENPEGEEEGDDAKKTNTTLPQAPSKSADSKYSGGTPRTVVGDSLQPMSAFENLFRKTLVIEADDEEMSDDDSDMSSDDSSSDDSSSDDIGSDDTVSGSDAVEDEGDLLSDLYDLQSTVSSIISKLEKAVEDAGNTVPDEQAYSADQFDDEFGGSEGSEEEPEVKAEGLNYKSLQKGSNKVPGTLNKTSGKGKAKTPTTKGPHGLKTATDGKKAVQKGNTVKGASLPKTNLFV